MQSQLKTFQRQLRTKRKKEKKNTGEAERLSFYCKCSFQFVIAHARACKGVPFVDLFFAIFENAFKKKAAVLKNVIFWSV